MQSGKAVHMTLQDQLRADLEQIYNTRGTRQYGLEDISQLSHALQSAHLAEQDGAAPALILASLLHDLGHLIHQLGENPAAKGTDDRHEVIGAKWLARYLPSAVTEPIRLHVSAKRYLCAVEPGYTDQLAPDSVLSLSLQGGAMSDTEITAFEANSFAQEAVKLRKWDDLAKQRDAVTPPLEHFLNLLPAAQISDQEQRSFNEHGFCLLRDFFTEDEAAWLQSRSDILGSEATGMLTTAANSGKTMADICAERPDALIPVAEANDPRKLCRFEFLLGHDAALAQFATQRLEPVINALGGEPFLPFKDKENEKLPGGGAFGPHQDFAAYQQFGPRMNITAMVSIDASTAANGCLAFATNLNELIAEHPSAALDSVGGNVLLKWETDGPSYGDIEPEYASHLQWTPIETKPNDLVVFNSFAPHRSCANHTDTSRRAMFFTYAPQREGDWYADYYAEKRANYADPKFHVSTPTRSSLDA